MATIPFEVEDGIDHVLHQLGPGDLAVLGDMADQHEGAAARLGEAHQGVRRRAHRLPSRGSLQPVDPQRLN